MLQGDHSNSLKDFTSGVQPLRSFGTVLFSRMDGIQVEKAPPKPPPFQSEPIEGGFPSYSSTRSITLSWMDLARSTTC
jgi:hypothetical protein